MKKFILETAEMCAECRLLGIVFLIQIPTHILSKILIFQKKYQDNRLQYGDHY